MGFRIPNVADAAFQPQAEPDQGDFQILADAFAGTHVVSGCLVDEAASPDMTVDVASGRVLVDNDPVDVTGGNTAITAADGSNPRIDLVTINSSGTIIVVDGTPASAPYYPTIPASRVVLAAVYVPAGDTAVTDNQIIDKRMIRPQIETHLIVPASAEDADITVGTGKIQFEMPLDFRLTGVGASLTTGPTGSGATFDINVNGSTILSTKITIDAGTTNSGAAGTPPVISSADIAEYDKVSVDVDAIGSTTAGIGLKIYLEGVKN